jgi:hypothetical protein
MKPVGTASRHLRGLSRRGFPWNSDTGLAQRCQRLAWLGEAGGRRIGGGHARPRRARQRQCRQAPFSRN